MADQMTTNQVISIINRARLALGEQGVNAQAAIDPDPEVAQELAQEAAALDALLG